MAWIDVVGIGIPICYAVIFFGAVTGAIAGQRLRDKLLLSRGGWIFLPCGFHYSFYVAYHDLNAISQSEKAVLVVVLVVAIVTAVFVNPITIGRTAGKIANQDEEIDRLKADKQISQQQSKETLNEAFAEIAALIRKKKGADYER